MGVLRNPWRKYSIGVPDVTATLNAVVANETCRSLR
jgi:hypothetical protein